MTSPAIVPLAPGERPTEPGWYVAEDGGCRVVVEISHSCLDLAFFTGVSGSATLDSLTFIARIFPDRIGQEGQMDRSALSHAFSTVARMLGTSLAGALTLTAAIWLPTLALRDLVGLPFLDAYLIGCPFGLLTVTLIGLGVMVYRQKARHS